MEIAQDPRAVMIHAELSARYEALAADPSLQTKLTDCLKKLVPVLQQSAAAERNDFSLFGLFGRGVRDNDARGRRALHLDSLHDNPVVEGTNLHFHLLSD